MTLDLFLFVAVQVIMDEISSPRSPLRQAFEGLSDFRNLSQQLAEKAAEELNETPERYKQELNTMKLLVASNFLNPQVSRS